MELAEITSTCPVSSQIETDTLPQDQIWARMPSYHQGERLAGWLLSALKPVSWFNNLMGVFFFSMDCKTGVTIHGCLYVGGDYMEK